MHTKAKKKAQAATVANPTELSIRSFIVILALEGLTEEKIANTGTELELWCHQGSGDKEEGEGA